jgi:NAD(P)-dependent dehydrogenase (short-subunit alcohol dehydrogenase family)
LEVIGTNVFGVSDVTQAFVSLLRKRGQDKPKKIFNISSSLGSIGLVDSYKLPVKFSPAYRTSKTALNMLTKLTADELAEENFIVTAVHPGWVRTDLGSEHADISSEESISGMLTVLGKLTAKDNGLFYNYDGAPLPW